MIQPSILDPRPRAPYAVTLAGWVVALALAAAGVARPSFAQSGPVEDLATFPRATLEIHTRTGSRRFEVWVANTQDRKTQGLMFVRDLPADEGMLFVDCCSGIWMKNTYISLDILFVGPTDRIVKIAAHAQPFDLATISASGPVKEVIELKGGEAERLGLAVGDRVSWKKE